MARVFIPDVVPLYLAADLGYYFTTYNHPSAILANKVIEELSTHTASPLIGEKKFIYIYYITIINTLYEMFGGTFPEFFKLSQSTYLANDHLETPKETPILKYIESLFTLREHAKYVSHFLNSLLPSEKRPSVFIYLQMTNNFTAIYSANNRLGSLYNDTYICITNDYSQADIVITDTLERATHSKNVFYLDSIENMESWQSLNLLIQSVYDHKFKTMSMYNLYP